MKALLIIDIQNDYFPGGKAELVNSDMALSNTEMILAFFRKEELPIIHVQHVNMREGAAFFLPNTEGSKIHEKLTPHNNEFLVIKNYPNSFYETNLLDVIKSNKITELVVCGMMTHMCIDTTVRAAKDYDLPVTLIADACATKDLLYNHELVPAIQVQTAFLAALNGMFAQITNTNDFLRV
ncbi:MAG: cysteine hydrolase family protein [Lachnospiraceae bacterium]